MLPMNQHHHCSLPLHHVRFASYHGDANIIWELDEICDISGPYQNLTTHFTALNIAYPVCETSTLETWLTTDEG